MNENLKKGLGVILEIGMTYDKAMADGQLSVVEKIELTTKAVVGGVTVLTNWKGIREDYKNLTAEGSEELKSWARDQFDIDNDYIEKKVEAGFNILVDIEEFILIKPAA